MASLGIILEAAGFHVRGYTDTAPALEALAAQPADVAPLDYHDRPIDGLELFRQLRALSDMPMIFLSADADVLEDMDVPRTKAVLSALRGGEGQGRFAVPQALERGA